MTVPAILDIDIQNAEFQDALRLVQYTRNSLFLTGKAGTGKSTFLRYICATTKKKHVVLAPTGIAAINAGGSTMHSFFKLPFYPLLPDDPRFGTRKIKEFLKYNSTQCKLLREVELIIIDEISMVRADIIDFIDKVLRVYSHNMREPFGGKQMLFVGDVFQLEPVVKADERELLNRFYATPYFFSARVFQEMRLVSIELKKVYRQSDRAFVAVLDHIRQNTAGTADLQLLNTRLDAPLANAADEESLAVTLATRRDNVDFINQQKLDELPGDALAFKGQITGEFPENSLPTLMELELKVGAQVIFIKNDADKRWVNGTLGIIEAIDEDGKALYIVAEDGRELEVERDRWSNVRYTYNEAEKKIEEEELGVFVQFPVRLAWAITVHKSQGLTFRKAIIDFTGGVFAGGQAYVALSRCTSLDGIQLRKQINRADIFVKPEIVQFAQQFNSRQAIEGALKVAQADIKYAEANQAFERGDFEAFLDDFFVAIHARYDIEKPLVRRFLRRKLARINTLKARADNATAKMLEMQKNLEKYAKEYYQMGNECVTHAHNLRAAVANYDKAIELNPRYTDAYVQKGVALLRDGKPDEALTPLNVAVGLSPALFKALYNRGRCQLELHHYEEAAADFDKAIGLKAEHPKAHELFGDALSQMGKEDEAAIQWSIAQRLREGEDGDVASP